MKKIINPFISGDDGLDLFNDIFLNHLLPFSVKRMKKDEIVFHPDCSHKYCYYVKDGLIKISVISVEGKEKDLFFHGIGSIFGFQNFNNSKVTITRASAVIDSELYQFEHNLFHELLRNSPDHFSLFLSYIFNMFFLLAHEVINLSCYTTNERLSGLLVILEKKFNSGQIEGTTLPYNNEELATILGVSRNSISSAVTFLQAEQIIEKKRNGIIVKDFRKLIKYATK